VQRLAPQVAETPAFRFTRGWLEGPRANQPETLARAGSSASPLDARPGRGARWLRSRRPSGSARPQSRRRRPYPRECRPEALLDPGCGSPLDLDGPQRVARQLQYQVDLESRGGAVEARLRTVRGGPDQGLNDEALPARARHRMTENASMEDASIFAIGLPECRPCDPFASRSSPAAASGKPPRTRSSICSTPSVAGRVLVEAGLAAARARAVAIPRLARGPARRRPSPTTCPGSPTGSLLRRGGLLARAHRAARSSTRCAPGRR
jgi:hypothetical protein